MVKPQKIGNQVHRNNASVIQKKEQDARRKQPMQMEDAIYINN
jgi:hypothetical protein